MHKALLHVLVVFLFLVVLSSLSAPAAAPPRFCLRCSFFFAAAAFFCSRYANWPPGFATLFGPPAVTALVSRNNVQPDFSHASFFVHPQPTCQRYARFNWISGSLDNFGGFLYTCWRFNSSNFSACCCSYEEKEQKRCYLLELQCAKVLYMAFLSNKSSSYSLYVPFESSLYVEDSRNVVSCDLRHTYKKTEQDISENNLKQTSIQIIKKIIPPHYDHLQSIKVQISLGKELFLLSSCRIA